MKLVGNNFKWKLILLVSIAMQLFLMCSTFHHRFRHSQHKLFPSFTTLYKSTVTMSTSEIAPKVISVDKQTNKAVIQVTLTGEMTEKSFAKTLEAFNAEVAKRQIMVPGFRKGAKLPAMYLYQIFGEDQVKTLCGTLLSKEIQDECDKTGLSTVGRGTILDFRPQAFSSGKPHTIDVEVELWPEITYKTSNTYKGLKVTVEKEIFDEEKYEKTKKSIQERYKDLQEMSDDYVAQDGDVAVVNMNGFELNSDQSKGSPLPSVAQGDSVEVNLEKGKYMEGLVEGIIGAKKGDFRQIKVKFPRRPTGAGAALSGKEALFEINVLAVKKKILSPWDDSLAARIRPGMTLSELDNEVRSAIEGEKSKSVESKRNDALANALIDVAVFNYIPESLIDDNTQDRFQNMIMDFKDQGSTDEQIKEMTTPENYAKYKEISRPNTEKVVKLGLLFREISDKENIKVTEEEIKQQLDLLTAQMKQKNQGAPDERQARDEIENTLLRLKIFDFLASSAEITYVDAPTK